MRQRERILVLGGGRGQLGLIKAAKDLGVETFVASLPSSSAPGLRLADRVLYVDIADPERVLEAAREHDITAIATSCVDTGLPALGRACTALRLRGLSEEAAQICADKLRMKQVFESHGVKTARYRRVSTIEDLHAVIDEFGFPLVIKAVDRQGSQGISIVDNESQAEEGYEHAKALTQRDYLVVEQFIEGNEFGAQALIRDGKILFVMPHGDEVFMARTAVPVGHYVPLARSESFITNVIVEVERAIGAVGLDNAAVNVDMIARGDEIFIIEITGRAGANGLPELVSARFGLNYYETLARLALGTDLGGEWSETSGGSPAAAVRMLIAPELSGQIESIEIDYDSVPEARFEIFRNPGDRVNGFTNSGDCIGQISTSGDSLPQVFDILKRSEEAVVIRLEGTLRD